MAEAGWLGHGVRIGWFEFRRTIRALRADSARLALIALGVVVPGVLFTGGVVLFADVLRSVSGPIALPAFARGMIAVLWLFGVYLIAQRTLTQRTRIEAEELVLTTVSARTVATGLVVAEICRAIAYLALPVVVLTGVFVVLFGSVTSLVFVPLAVSLFAGTAVLAGATVGFAGALLVARSPFVARHTTVLGTAAVLVVFGAYFLFIGSVGGVSPALLAWLPVGWYADLATLRSPIAASPARALGSLGTTALVVGAFGVGTERLTTELWFDEPVSGDEGSGGDEAGERAHASIDASNDENGLAAAIGLVDRPLSVASRPTRQVARMALLRTRREPRRLSFLVTPLAIVGVSIGNVAVQSGGVAAMVPIACALFGPWLAGAVFALNPLGEEGAVLPATLLSIGPRAYVRGVMLPGAVFGLPLVCLSAIAGGAVAVAASAYTPVEAAGMVGIGLVLTAVSVPLAPAIGTRLPRFSAISVGQSRDVLPPSLLAVVWYSVVVFGLGALAALAWLVPTGLRLVFVLLFSALPAVAFGWLADEGLAVGGLSNWFGGVGDSIGALSPIVIRFGVPALVVCAGLAIAAWSYRSAVGRFETYTISS